MPITQQQIADKRITASSDNPNRLICFASDIECFRKGFPKTLMSNIGNNQPFCGVARKVVDGDLQYVRYIQLDSDIELVVFND